MGPSHPAPKLVKLIPPCARTRSPSSSISRTPSSASTLDSGSRWLIRVNQFVQDDPASPQRVTSGPTRSTELGFFLDLTVRSAKPVVVVGSMRNPSTLGYEGAANLLEGFRVAADPAAAGRGVMVVLNDEINAAREVTKTDALRLNTFQTRGYGVLGVVDSDRVVFYRRVEKKHTVDSEFDISSVTTLPRVDVILTYQGVPAPYSRARGRCGAKGILLAGTQTPGHDWHTWRGSARRSEGVFIVSTTRAGSGRIAARPRPPATPGAAPNPRERFISGEDLAPVKARLLLMLALTKSQTGADIQRMFVEY